MKHLIISDYGTFLGLNNHRLAVKNKEEIKFFPLNRLATVSITKRGVSFSSDLIETFSQRGIRLFFLDFRGVAHSVIMGNHQHGVVAIRLAQMKYYEQNNLSLAKKVITGKIKNQRATLNYFDKYHKSEFLQTTAESLLQRVEFINNSQSLDYLMGIEGRCAIIYFKALKNTSLFSSSFQKREGRGSQEINNALLNLGYAVLSSYVLNAIINAGLEPYLGIMHRTRAGKMALVFDLMEEYRAWVVDRSVVKFRKQTEMKKEISLTLKKDFIKEIQKTCSKKYPYRGKKVKLEHIIQRQVYRLCSQFYGESRYKPYLFKW